MTLFYFLYGICETALIDWIHGWGRTVPPSTR